MAGLSGGWARSRALMLLAALTTVVPASSASAHGPGTVTTTATGGSLHANPTIPIVGESTVFSGRLTPHVRRPITLQRLRAGAWHPVASGHSSTKGRFHLRITVPHTTTPTRFRVEAPAGVYGGRRLAEAVTNRTTVTPVAQTATLDGPASSRTGAALNLHASFEPARRGRAVQVERRDGASWAPVTTTLENASGAITVHTPAPIAARRVSYRAVALPWHGAATVVARRSVPLVPTWRPPVTLSRATGYLHDVSCASSTFCAAVDQTGNALTYDGTSWTLPATIDPESGLTGVSCPTSTFCVAVGQDGQALTFDGTAWSPPVEFDPDGSPIAVSCASATFCVSVGFHGTVSTFDGTRWSHPVTVADSLQDVSCPAPGHCTVLDFDDHSYTWGGSSLSTPSTVSGGLPAMALSCATSTHCVAIDESTYSYVYDGSSWSQVGYAGGSLYALSCPTTTFCAAATGSGDVVTFDGTTWSPERPASSGLHDAAAISCTSSTSCVLAGESAAAVLSGTTWTATEVDAPSGGLATVSCVDATSCHAVDRDGNVFTWDGTTWSPPVSVDTDAQPTSISCASRTLCTLVDDRGRAATLTGANWSSPTPISDSPLNSVSCALSSQALGDNTCLAVGDDMGAHSLGSQGWITGPALDTKELWDVSCATRADCVVVDELGSGIRYHAGTWGPPVKFDSSGIYRQLSLSCSGPSFCTAVGHGSRTWTFDGRVWKDAGLIGPGAWLTIVLDVSCASSTSCVAVTESGTSTYDGHLWTTPDHAFGGATELSCPTTAFCATAGFYGVARVFE